MDKTSANDPMHHSPPPPLAGLDPADLLRQGAAEDTFAGAAAFQPPSIEEMAVLFPQFEILELIGKGGMGAVYKVRQKDLDRVVALKILPPAIGQSPEFSNRFAREAKALAKLNHPGIVTLHEFGQTSSSQPSTIESQPLYYILMEFVDGVNLAQLMRGGRISTREALAIVPQICDALQFAHDQGIVHRDIKPENILLDRLGRVKVADFGIAKVVAAVCEDPIRSGDTPGPTDATIAGKIIGTPQYMAPEQIDHPSEVDHRADIYALGVVFYQMLTGELPGKRLEVPSRKVQIDVRLDEIVLRAMEKEPELRYQTAHELRTILDGMPPSSPQQQSARKPRVMVGRFGIAALMVLVGVGLWNMYSTGIRFESVGSGSAAFEEAGAVMPEPAVSAASEEMERSAIPSESDEELTAEVGDAPSVKPEEQPQPLSPENAAQDVQDVQERLLTAQRSVELANQYLDLIMGIASAKAAGIGEAHPAMIMNARRLDRLSQEYPQMPDATCFRIASYRLEDLREQVTGLMDGGMGLKHPTVVAMQARIDALVAILPDDFAPGMLQEEESGALAPNKPEIARTKIVIGISSDQEILLDGMPIEWPALPNELKKLAEKDQGVPVVIRGASGIPYAKVVEVIDLCQQSGIWNISFAKDEQGKLDTAAQWLGQLDEGNYAACYAALADRVRTAIPEEEWSEAMIAFRKPLGAVVSRRMTRNEDVRQLPGAPHGEHRVMVFTTEFENKKEAVETVIQMKGNDGVWRASNYHVN